MSDTNDKSNAFYMWIPSLAVSIVCCSVLFVVFADYLSDIKETMASNTARLEMLDRRTNQIRMDMSVLAKRLPPPPAGQAAAVEAPAPAVPAETAPVVTPPAVAVPAVAAPVTDVATTPPVAPPPAAAPAVAAPAATTPPQK